MIRSDLIVPLINVLLLALAAFIVLLAAERRWKLLSSFRAETGPPLHLALARVVIISALLSKVSLRQEILYSTLDKSLVVPPVGWSHLAPHIPRNPDLVTILYGLFVFFGVLAIVGLFGRLACLLTSALGFYLLTLPQLFGKINHDHNLILFGFLLALSSCCDTLSVDAIRGAIKAGRRGTYTSAPKDSLAYADPLKAMMVLMGLIYFFPGAWKVARLGFEWFSVDNMRWTMAKKLFQSPHVTFVQEWAIHHPLALLGGAVFTPLFELGFIFAIFSRRTRAFAAACGLMFHNAIGLLLNIPFVGLQLCYVIFIDWTRVLAWIAAQWKIGRITVLRFGQSELPALNILSKFDWLDLVSVETPAASFASELLLAPDRNGLTVVDDSGINLSGYEACLSIMKRIVCLWPIYPILSSKILRKIGASIYEHFQHARENRNFDAGRASLNLPSDPRIGILFRIVSGTFVLGMILAGLTHSVNAWPIACYPTFDHLESNLVIELSARATDDSGQVYDQTLSFDPKIEANLSPERYDAMLASLMSQDVPDSRQRAVALVNIWRQAYNYPEFKEVTLYSCTYALDADGKLSRLIDNREISHLERSDGLQ